MKKNILTLFLATGFLMANVACDDGMDDYKGEFDTILYFRDSGELPVTVYKTGSNTEYNLNVIKAGFEKKEAVVSVDVMSDAELLAYNIQNGVNYKALPSSCYILNDKQIKIDADDSHKNVSVSLVTDQIEASLGNDATYVIPFELYGGSDSINSKKRVVFVKPSVETVSVGFETPGLIETEKVVETEGIMDVKVPVVLPVEDQWNLSFEVEVDEEVLKNFNEENRMDMWMLPEGMYSVEVPQFELGKASAPVMLHIDKSQLPWGVRAIPLRIKSVSISEFIISEQTSTCVVAVNHSFPRAELAEIPLSRDMLYSNAVIGEDGSDGTGLYGLFDGRGVWKHFITDYEGNVIDQEYGHYIDFTLPQPINHFAYNIWTRFEEAGSAPKVTVIYAGNDGQNWVKIGTVFNEFTMGDEEYDSDTFSSETSFTKVRFSVIESNNGDTRTGGFWNCGEMQIFGK